MRPTPSLNLFPYFQTVHDLPEIIDWKTFFESDQPVELDIGCGRGMFLFNAASTTPEHNFLGLELDFKEGRRAARRLWKRKLPNARLVGGDAREVLSQRITPHSVHAAHVYFPDPWWKKKHMRRRLFTDEFANLLTRVVMPGGLIHSWTDVEDYFEVISALMDHHPDVVPLPPPDERAAEHDLDYHTSFERKKRQAGLLIYRGRWQRKPL